MQMAHVWLCSNSKVCTSPQALGDGVAMRALLCYFWRAVDEELVR